MKPEMAADGRVIPKHGPGVCGEHGNRAHNERAMLRIRDRVSVRIRDRHVGEETVSCIISGHDRTGEELVADELTVEDDALRFSFRGTCGYGSTFDYAGA